MIQHVYQLSCRYVVAGWSEIESRQPASLYGLVASA